MPCATYGCEGMAFKYLNSRYCMDCIFEKGTACKKQKQKQKKAK